MGAGGSDQRASETELRRGGDRWPIEGFCAQFPATPSWGAKAVDRPVDRAREHRPKQKGDPHHEVTLCFRVFLPVFSP